MRKEEKHVEGMKKQVHLHPPGLKSPPSGIHKLYPYPQAIRPSPRAQKKGRVFEDASRGGLCRGHRITAEVTGLDTSVRCYALAHILTGPF